MFPVKMKITMICIQVSFFSEELGFWLKLVALSPFCFVYFWQCVSFVWAFVFVCSQVKYGTLEPTKQSDM